LAVDSFSEVPEGLGDLPVELEGLGDVPVKIVLPGEADALNPERDEFGFE